MVLVTQTMETKKLLNTDSRYQELLKCIESLANQKVAVFGDAILDKYVFVIVYDKHNIIFGLYSITSLKIIHNLNHLDL